MSAHATFVRSTEGTAAAPNAISFRSLAALGVAGAVAGGIAGGLGSRVVMRISAVAAGEAAQGALTEAEAVVGRITADGTIFLILFAGLTSCLVGIGSYLVVRRWLPSATWARAASFGAFELVVFGGAIIDPGNSDFVILGHPLLNVSMFGALFLLHGALLVALEGPASRLVSVVGAGPRWRRALVKIVGAGSAVLAGFGTFALVLAPGGLGHGIFAAVLVACSAALLDLGARPARPVTRLALRRAGALALGGVVALGAVGLLDAVTTIL